MRPVIGEKGDFGRPFFVPLLCSFCSAVFDNNHGKLLNKYGIYA